MSFRFVYRSAIRANWPGWAASDAGVTQHIDVTVTPCRPAAAPPAAPRPRPARGTADPARADLEPARARRDAALDLGLRPLAAEKHRVRRDGGDESRIGIRRPHR